MRLLLVEDDADVADPLVEGLAHEGYRVDVCYDGATALELLTDPRTGIELVVLDRDLPGVSGDTVCRTLRATNHPARIIMLTAAGSLQDRVRGFELGADDYLPKPFAFVELVARLRALARRGPAIGALAVIERAGVRIDVARRIAERAGRQLRLTPREYAVLESLIRADGAYRTLDSLLHEIWDAPHDVTNGAAKVVVHSLRRKLGDPPLIDTTPGFGYRIVQTGAQHD